MELPQEYIDKMTDLLGEEEFPLYLASLEEERSFGVRVNTLKISNEDFLEDLGEIINVKKIIPWTNDGYYYAPFEKENTELPGKLPFYHAGLYYIQEPSAMYPAQQLDVKPGDKVLDLCAAPGGKSTKLGVKLSGEGLLVANDISQERVKALIYNLELAGVRNVIVTNESPERLAKKFNGYFDKILVDAPCSGEGMFRKDNEAVKSWGKFKTEVCAGMQREILEYAHVMLKPGGHILYSTCTFDPSEDEYMIKEFMEKFPEYELLPLEKRGGIADGLYGMSEAARLWPHKLKGEGHFTAMLEKKTQAKEENSKKSDYEKKSNNNKSYKVLKDAPDEFKTYWKKNMQGDIPSGYYYVAGEGLYFLPCVPPDIDGLKVPKIGLNMGELNHCKFKPSQQFAMAYGDMFARKITFAYDSEDVKRYLRGETITVSSDFGDGWHAVCVGVKGKTEKGYVLGTGVINGGMLKNMYPKGWRRLI